MPNPSEESMRYGEIAVDVLTKSLGDRLFSITMFGSRARGDDTEESDIDLLILADLSGMSSLQVIKAVRMKLDAIDISKDLLTITPQEFKSPRFVLRRTIEKEGVVLYEREH
ncbi:hypothetical protein J41TS12_04940 [Paenibacillus antibioticophila]|uniref:Polymerase beta nucleotidyltransferase domain-containing protein n=1 Tax=Paenibacillus antibioticophila TaxID=1274374 RepID=A0A919XQD7_9BACL|nr:nucleotidyltransferase domain-containing protein [Paenibacillus antibioticophila]GIO35633.1 hypothetical protein J41TS12_04940 [Paenibacillus antibioticophila]